MQSSLHLPVRPGFWRTAGSASLRAAGLVRAGCWRTTGSNSLRAAGPVGAGCWRATGSNSLRASGSVRAGLWRTTGSAILRAAGPVGAGCLRATGSAILRAAGPVGRPQASGRHQAPARYDQARGPRGTGWAAKQKGHCLSGQRPFCAGGLGRLPGRMLCGLKLRPHLWCC